MRKEDTGEIAMTTVQMQTQGDKRYAVQLGRNQAAMLFGTRETFNLDTQLAMMRAKKIDVINFDPKGDPSKGSARLRQISGDGTIFHLEGTGELFYKKCALIGVEITAPAD